MTPHTTIDPKLLQHVECPQVKNGKPVTETKKVKGEMVERPVLRRVKATEVLAHSVDLDAGIVHVVTTQGRKYFGPVPKGWEPPTPPADGEES